MCPNISGIVAFDLDGTLIDASPAWCAAAVDLAAHKVQREVPYPRHLDPRQVIEQVTGRSAADQFEDFWALVSGPHFEKVVLHKGVVRAIESIRRTRAIYLFSNKKQAFVEDIAHRLGVAGLFKEILGGDSHGRKPDPGGLRYIKDVNGDCGERTFYVGDTTTDLECAGAAGCNFIFASWGRGTEAQLERYTGFEVAYLPEDIPGLLESKRYGEIQLA